MVDHDSLTAAFAGMGIDVNRADPAKLAMPSLAEPVRRVLTEVGLPEVLSDHVIFDDLQEGSPLMRQVGEGRTQLRLGSGLHDDAIVVDGGTGEVFARQNGALRRITPSLDSFVEFIYIMQSQISKAEAHRWTSVEDVASMRQETYARMVEADQQAMTEAGDYWRDMFEYSI
jgi:hypothetical protein